MLLAIYLVTILAIGLIGLALYTYLAMNRLDPLNDEEEVQTDRKFRHEHGTMAEQSWP